MSKEALKLMEQELHKEIRWLENHRGYFRTPGCADHVVDRLQRKIEWIKTRIQVRFTPAPDSLLVYSCDKCQTEHPTPDCPEEVQVAWCAYCRREHPVVRCSFSR